MEKRKCLIRLSYERIHKLLNLSDNYVIESIFITSEDKMSDRITVKLSSGPYLVVENEMMPYVRLEDL